MPESAAVHAVAETAALNASAPDAASSRDVKDKVRRYYRAATEDYLKYYEADWHHHMHYGFERDLPKGGNPTENLVRYMARLAGLLDARGEGEPPLQVLDAGCGVGGSSIWLARNAGCRCVGITLMESQARLARGYAARGKAAGARFAANDFTLPAFKPGTFDVVWALESFDHAPDKAAWLREMHALLKPGGRLILADGFRAPGPMDPALAKDYARFLSGWAVPHLCTLEELTSWARSAGFETLHAEDISADVLPHALAIYRFGLLFIPWRWVLRKLGLTSEEKLGNAYATFHQYRTLKRGLWTYGAYCFRKPG